MCCSTTLAKSCIAPLYMALSCCICDTYRPSLAIFATTGWILLTVQLGNVVGFPLERDANADKHSAVNGSWIHALWPSRVSCGKHVAKAGDHLVLNLLSESSRCKDCLTCCTDWCPSFAQFLVRNFRALQSACECC